MYCTPGSIGLLIKEVRDAIADKTTAMSRVVADINPEIPLSAFKDHRIAIDVLSIFHPQKITAYNDHIDASPNTVPNDYDITTGALMRFAKLLASMVHQGCVPVCVMDGRATKLKSKTQITRRKKTDEYSNQQVEAEIRLEQLEEELAKPKAEPQTEEEHQQRAEEMLVAASEKTELTKRVATAMKGSVRISEEDKQRLNRLVSAMGLPYIIAPEEAEKYCAQLVREGHCRAALSSDTDLFAHGCPVIIRQLKGNVARVCILDNVLRQLDMSYETFVDFCVMCGTDYNPNVPGFGTERSYKLIQQYGSLEAMPEVAILEVRMGKGVRKMEYRKSLLRNEGEKLDWQHIRREFLEKRYQIDPEKLEVEECDMPLVREMLNDPNCFHRYAAAHSYLMDAETRKVPFLDYY